LGKRDFGGNNLCLKLIRSLRHTINLYSLTLYTIPVYNCYVTLTRTVHSNHFAYSKVSIFKWLMHLWRYIRDFSPNDSCYRPCGECDYWATVSRLFACIISFANNNYNAFRCTRKNMPSKSEILLIFREACVINKIPVGTLLNRSQSNIAVVYSAMRANNIRIILRRAYCALMNGRISLALESDVNVQYSTMIKKIRLIIYC